MADPREQPLNDVARDIMVQSNYDPHFSGIEERLIMETKLFLARLDAARQFDYGLIPRPGIRPTPFVAEVLPALLDGPKPRQGNFHGVRDALKIVRERLGRTLAVWIVNEIGGEKTLAEVDYKKHAAVIAACQTILRWGWVLKPSTDPIPMILFCPSCGVQHVDKAESHKPDCTLVLKPAMEVRCDCGAWTNPPHRSHLCAYCAHVWRPADVPTTGVLTIETHGERDHQPIRSQISPAARFRPQWRHKARGTSYVELGRGELQTSRAVLTLSEGHHLVAYQGDDNRVWFRTEAEFDEPGRFEKIEK